MTAFGIYLVVIFIIAIAGNLYFAGQGTRVKTVTAGQYWFGAAWAAFHLIGILVWGTGFGVN